ncbi:MAG: peptidoglycan recognition protein family protein [Spirochaetota bacterium]|nr:peptidoglycan recognition protein family protein [Spirochaetota bacterium]
MSIKDYKKLSYDYKNKHQKNDVLWYQNLNPKPYLIIMGILLLIIISLSWYYKNIPSNLDNDKLELNNIANQNSNRWKFIVIHHSGIEIGDLERYKRYHQKEYHNGGLLYHFLIGNGNGTNDGKVEISERWKKQRSGGHVSESADEYNKWGIGICLVGDFEHKLPSRKQMRSLVALTKYLMAKFNISPENVLTHHQVNSTKCPGKYFPESDFFNEIGKQNIINSISAK